MNNNVEPKQKVNPFKYFLKHLGNIWYDFRTSFKYNNMKLAGLLVAVPGVFLGFFLGFHGEVVTKMSFVTKTYDPITDEMIEGTLLKPFDFSGIVLFLMVLFGILNIFTAVTMSGKKNLGSVVLATITTAAIVICGGLYLYTIFYYTSLLSSGKVTATTEFYDINFIMSVVSVIISIVTSVAGIIIGFIRYDRTYEKVDR